MRSALLALVALATVRTAAAECPKPKGKPIYRQERGPRQVDPGTPAPEPTEVLALYPGGAWTFVTDSEGIAPQSGCIPAAALREVTAALGRAKFAHPRGPVTTCAALPTSRITYAAPRRGGSRGPGRVHPRRRDALGERALPRLRHHVTGRRECGLRVGPPTEGR